jgi:hypothetical protein
MIRSSFPSVESLLVFAFESLQTSLLSLSKIMSFLQDCPHAACIVGMGPILANRIPRRLVLNTLSNSQAFVRSGTAESQSYALRPNNPLFKCDLEIVALIEQILDENGPLTPDELFSSPVFAGSARNLLSRIIEVHCTEFTILPDGKVWFPNTPLPPRSHFATFGDALEFALSFFPQGATTEELKRILSLSTCDEGLVTRIALVTVLSSIPDRFVQIQRGKYVLSDGQVESKPSGRFTTQGIAPMLQEDDMFNPESFFGGKFLFAAE